jgi:hypothetical protein
MAQKGSVISRLTDEYYRCHCYLRPEMEDSVTVKSLLAALLALGNAIYRILMLDQYTNVPPEFFSVMVYRANHLLADSGIAAVVLNVFSKGESVSPRRFFSGEGSDSHR